MALPLAAALTFFGTLALVLYRQRFLAFLLVFLWYSFTWRITSVAYIDIAGPLYSVELFRDLGGGAAAVPLAFSYLLFIGALLVVFRPSRARALAGIPVGGEMDPEHGRQVHARVSAGVFAFYAAFVVMLFVDLARGGVIPLFAGIERYVFTAEIGGGFHGALVKYGMHLSFFLGTFFAYGVLIDGRPDRRFLLILVSIYFYLLLVGNRFSAFNAFTTFFLIPWAIISMKRQYAGLVFAGRGKPWSKGQVRLMQIGVGATLLGMVGYAFYRSLLFTRGMGLDLAIQNVIHRIFVLQGELFTATYERVFERGIWDGGFTFRRLFIEPVWDPSRNTTLPHLMELEIGERVYPILEIGSTYTGGFPEILFELLGPVFGFAGVFVTSYILSLLLYELLRAVIEQRYVRTVLVFWITYLVLLFPGGGMLNAFGNWKFVVKLAAVVTWLLWEAGRRRGAQAVAAPEAPMGAGA